MSRLSREQRAYARRRIGKGSFKKFRDWKYYLFLGQSNQPVLAEKFCQDSNYSTKFYVPRVLKWDWTWLETFISSWRLIWDPLSLLSLFFFLSLHFDNMQSASFIPSPFLRYSETFMSIPKLLLTKYSQAEIHNFSPVWNQDFYSTFHSCSFFYYILQCILWLFFCDISITCCQ